MKTKDAIAVYLERHWSLVPIPKGEKGPRISNWQHRTFTADDFSATDNIGVKLGKVSADLVDVDLDTIEACAAAPALLITTGLIHGRPSKPQSHYWYTCADSKSEQFKDTDGTMLVELRSNGGQTVVPPSVHKTGEKLAWEVDKTPTVVTYADLRRCVAYTATAAILARHWPAEGSRHDCAGLAAGLLASLKVDNEAAARIIEQAATIAHDADVKDRVVFARDTLKKFASGFKVKGGPKLAELIGEDVVKTIRYWYDSDAATKSLIEKLNEKHAVIFQQSGDIVVITEEEEDGAPQLRFSAPTAMPLLYPQKIQVGVSAKNAPIYSTLGSAWLNSPKRRFYRGIELAPNGKANANYYNMWRGFTVEPKKGDWSLFREHLLLLAQEDPTFAEYILAWMSETVKHPDTPIGIALAFKGGQGTGKSTFSKWFGALFGPHFLHLDSEQRLLGHFNAHLHNAILILADEAVWAGGKQGLGALKRMITETTLAIERKGLDTINVKNMLHMMVASNENWVVPADWDDRRFAVFEVSKAKQNNHKFFGAVRQQLFEQGGLAALLYDLLEFDSSKVNLRAIPETKERERQKQHSLQPKQAWWFQQLCDAEWWDGYPADVEVEVDREAVYQQFAGSLKMADRFVNVGLKGALGRYLQDMMPPGYPQTRQRGSGDDRGKRYWVFPSLDACRKTYDEKFGTINWELHTAILHENDSADGRETKIEF